MLQIFAVIFRENSDEFGGRGGVNLSQSVAVPHASLMSIGLSGEGSIESRDPQ